MRPAAVQSSDSKNVSKVSFAWKRRKGVPTGKIFANAFSFMGSLACKYRFVVSMHGRVYLVACVPPEGSATKIEMACAQSAHLHQRCRSNVSYVSLTPVRGALEGTTAEV